MCLLPLSHVDWLVDGWMDDFVDTRLRILRIDVKVCAYSVSEISANCTWCTFLTYLAFNQLAGELSSFWFCVRLDVPPLTFLSLCDFLFVCVVNILYVPFKNLQYNWFSVHRLQMDEINWFSSIGDWCAAFIECIMIANIGYRLLLKGLMSCRRDNA